jgi:hypothetical protein
MHRRPRAALSRATCPPLPCRQLPDPALARSCFPHVAPPPPELPRLLQVLPTLVSMRGASLGLKTRPVAAPRLA